jgi:hopene-associated glycosyltransferase HpnB
VIGAVLALTSLAVWLYLAFGHGRFWQAGPTLPTVRNGEGPPVAIVIPARDEAAAVESCLRSLLAQDYTGPLAVWLVDDNSTDGTGAIARAIDDPRLTVLTGQPRPPGWSGKLWAVSQGVAAAGGWNPPGAEAGFLLLTDADIVHGPAHVGTLVAGALSGDRDQVSEMVELHCESVAERALVPAFVFFFQMLYPFRRVAEASSRAAAAAGGVILIRRNTLRRIGGIEAVRGALIDDVALAGAVKSSGGRIWLGHANHASSVRPYPGAIDVWRMVARTAYVQLRLSPLLLAATVAAMALVWLVPVTATLAGHGAACFAGAAAFLLSLASFQPTLRRFRLSPLWALALPAIALFYLAATIGSAIDHHRGRGVVWKSRAYTGEDTV